MPSTVQSSRRGRPRFEVPQEQIEYLRYLSFSWTSIALMLGVSRMTVYRRKREYGISSANCSLTDSDLDACLRDIRRELPYSGEIIIMGRLRSMQYCIPRKRVRESLRRIDPLNTPLRWGRNRHTRRPYYVPGPNSLWHLGEFSTCLPSIVHRILTGKVILYCLFLLLLFVLFLLLTGEHPTENITSANLFLFSRRSPQAC